MSMHLSVYIGPYLVCKKKSLDDRIDIYELTEGKLYGLRGELAVEDKSNGDYTHYIGPNVDIPGLGRDPSYGMWNHKPVEVTPRISAEKDLFGAHFLTEINRLRPFYASVEIVWGVVPCYS